jgi:hypothetical protein
MQVRAARRTRVLDGALEVVAKALLASREAGGAALAALRIPRRHVVQHHLEPRIARRRGDVLGFPFVGILVLDGAKPRPRRGREALQERDLDEQG